MKKKLLIALSLIAIITSSIALGAYAATSTKLWINGKLMQAEIKVIDGKTYVPLRIVSESLGADVKIDKAANVISIASKGNKHTYTAATTPTTTTKPAASTKKISDPSTFNYSINSADGIKVTWLAVNNTGKTINYYTLNMSTYNAVGDPSYDELTGKSTFSLKYVGPVKNGEQMAAFQIFTYQAALHTIKINTIDLVYSDGTKETVTYSFKTSNSGGLE